MNFEERLLRELTAEITERAKHIPEHHQYAHARFRRLVAATAIGIIAILVMTTWTITGGQSPAYAITRNSDGSITVKINDFRDPDQLEKDLTAVGVHTDISYLPQNKRCANNGRGTPVDPQPPPELIKAPKKLKEWVQKNALDTPSLRAFQWPHPHRTPVTFKIIPKEIKPGQTLIIEAAESHRTKLWKINPYLVTGPVKPCVLENDPFWN